MVKKQERLLHTIRLVGFDMEEGKISFSFLSQLSEQISKISESTLKLYIEGNSLLKRGKMPDWLKNSLDFTWTGLSKGSTVLEMEAPLLKDTLTNIQYPLFNELGTEDYSNDTAFSLAMVAYQKAISNDRETDLLDKYLLNEMLIFKKLVSKGGTTIQLTCPSNKRVSLLNQENLERISILESVTPSPLKIQINGKLDMMKHSNSNVEILAGTRSIKAKLPENITIEEIKPLFGKEVTVIGMGNFNPAHQLVSITVMNIETTSERKPFFELIPRLLKDETDLKELIAKKSYKGFNKIKFDNLIDDLEVNEPIERLLSILSK